MALVAKGSCGSEEEAVSSEKESVMPLLIPDPVYEQPSPPPRSAADLDAELLRKTGHASLGQWLQEMEYRMESDIMHRMEQFRLRVKIKNDLQGRRDFSGSLKTLMHRLNELAATGSERKKHIDPPHIQLEQTIKSRLADLEVRIRGHEQRIRES
eukprot:CAMPEP_0172832412 /NCGR_PEP_ID=MMETSP1075-20121228/23647_1 /TAXON_ID=2916 /ORGANISM="Ceratium fusus, Strain PA161109" /LENGTH=154 /DNA_ID=CAMNT_0013675011 /DNA_START=14 /DNA_END=475 /DNA_ORIENTATION=-